MPPFVTITSGPNGTVTGSQVEFNFQADRSGVTVQCDLTGPGQTAGYETCYKENAQPYTGLADGPYTFSVRAVNTAVSGRPGHDANLRGQHRGAEHDDHGRPERARQ